MSPVPSLGVWSLPGLPLFESGDDLAGAIVEALERIGLRPQAGDVLVVAQKVVSKVEGRAVRLDLVSPSTEAQDLAARTGKTPELCELILRESSELVRVRDQLVIVRHRLGHVLANAGIDGSNVGDPNGPPTVMLWPVDPDESARDLRGRLEARFGVPLAVIVSDSVGRAWRIGTLGMAIGVSGLKPVRDRRGEVDLFGRVLQVTMPGVADEIAAAASLVIGEAAEQTPVALVRGAVYQQGDEGVAGILRPIEADLFR